MFGSAAPSNEHQGALQHSCVGSPRHATIHRRGSRRTTARPRTTVCGGSTASLGNAARRPGYSRKTVWQQKKSCGVAEPESRSSPPAPIHAPPVTARDVRAAARAPLPGQLRAASPSAALCLAPGVHGSARYTKGDATNRDRSSANLQPRQQFAGQRTHRSPTLGKGAAPAASEQATRTK